MRVPGTYHDAVDAGGHVRSRTDPQEETYTAKVLPWSYETLNSHELDNASAARQVHRYGCSPSVVGGGARESHVQRAAGDQ
jgi:hypothetical protein